MIDHTVDIHEALFKGIGYSVLIILVYIIITLLIRLILKNYKTPKAYKTTIYVLLTFIFIMVLTHPVLNAKKEIDYYKNLKTKKGVVERIQYGGTKDIDKYRKFSVIELKDEQGKKTKYVLAGTHLPYEAKGKKMRINYEMVDKGTSQHNGNIKGFIHNYKTNKK
ncbi:hypothetical protein [Staphylococcus pettenkoferi]|uniref:hypothetical protein n=1 Tax=Staphylococcus pettenkoferi TaxID=170573 RepID=UPI0025559E83|nr:hypothetical protein [Staphylococcus pettenkoferi]MDK7284277.1 hypothetical protein [Staphylococcus pettenkoferi]